MGSNDNQNLQGLPAQMSQLHRRVVRVGAVAAWFCAAMYLALGLASGSDGLVVESLGPISAATLMTVQIIFGRENASVALIGSAAIVVVTYTLVANPATLLAAAIALVVICALAMLFVERHLPVISATLAGMLFFAPVLWETSSANPAQVGLMMSLAFLMSTTVFVSVRNSATAIDTKYRGMFEESPVALFDEDWSESLRYLRSIYDGPDEDLANFLEENPDIVRDAVRRSTVTKVNRAGVALLEAPSADALLGRRSAEAIGADLVDAYVQFLSNLYAEVEKFEVVSRRSTYRGKVLWLQANCVSPAGIGGPSSVLLAVADVTLSHERQEALTGLIEAKDKFIASVSHELRNPLTAVVGLTSEMTSRPMGHDETSELTALVASQAAEMSNIIEDLLVASRADLSEVPIELGSVDFGAQIAAAVSSTGLAPTAVPDDLPNVRADASRVRQILRNLLSNVERYGGVEYRVVGGSDSCRAWVEVRDNGSGVTPSEVETIFEPYTTAHAGVAGSVGLGLSVARQLAGLMGGTLQYRRDGSETVFRLELPLDEVLATSV